MNSMGQSIYFLYNSDVVIAVVGQKIMFGKTKNLLNLWPSDPLTVQNELDSILAVIDVVVVDVIASLKFKV